MVFITTGKYLIQSKESEDRNWSRCLGGRLLKGLVSLFSFTAQDHLPWVANHSGGDIFSIEVPFPQMILVYVELTKKLFKTRFLYVAVAVLELSL